MCNLKKDHVSGMMGKHSLWYILLVYVLEINKVQKLLRDDNNKRKLIWNEI